MLRTGVIGCGVISLVHIPIIINNKNTKLVCVSDIDTNKLKELEEKHQCKGYQDYKTMIDEENLDVVHICTPHYLHKEMIIYALEKGVNVLCEKPVVMNMKEASQVEKVLEKSSTKLGVVLQNRLNPTSIILKKYVDEKTLGEVKGIRAFVNWYRPAGYYTESDWRGKYATEGGGVLINQAIHTLDLMQWLGGEIEWVEGSHNTRLLRDYIEVEDTAEAILKYSNGAIGLFYATNCYVDNRPVEIEVLFEEGALRLINNALYLQKEKSFELLAKEQVTKSVKNYFGISHGKLIQNFYNAVLNDTDNYVSFNEGIKVLKLIEEIRVEEG
ncbi:Gfo/Idh/MocA family oxidoreductase [Clostridium sediminicola]|uniref:Gfo/Idh/MocA family protein n=1 Tax=Clostridium sediminicola TaxID=3114879 RepID=UPI0031F24054